ncbi:hypothetical protein [Amycolatopsis aidingensis]|uniref:hypothetical protein n=1 Tax=Amycolatopsis aidingensis TaxID=2842453 RepID=UPI001C0C97AC|nr:hypothetical protein [Amycolatopsis aidingensis]
MTTRLFVDGSYVPAGYRRRHGSFVRATVHNVLALAASGDEVFGTVAAPGRIGVVRGFDRMSRATRDEVRAVARRYGWSVLDLPTVPGFSAIPVAEDVTVVVPARRSLDPVAERCASFWNCCLLDTTAPGVASTSYVVRTAPALAVTTEAGQHDSITSRFELSGPAVYRSEGLPDVVVSAIAVQPSGSGFVVDHQVGDRLGSTRMVDTTLWLTLAEPVPGTIDGHSQLFPAGEYAITAGMRQVRRLVAAA